MRANNKKQLLGFASATSFYLPCCKSLQWGLRLIVALIFTSFVPVVSASLLDGLVVNLEFAGNTADTSGNGNHAINAGATLTDDRFNESGSAYDFNGTYMSMPNASVGNLSLDATVSVWINADVANASGSHRIIEKDDRAFWVIMFDGGRVLVYLRGQNSYGSPEAILLGPSIASLPSGWSHVVLRKNGGLFEFFVNGVLEDSANTAISAISTAATMRLGHSGFWHPRGDPQFYYGSIDSVRLYNRALSHHEIRTLYFEDGLRLYPNKGGDTGIVSVVLHGEIFTEGTTVHLSRNNETDIEGSPVVIDSNGALHTRLDLAGKARGLWDVIVTYPDLTEAILIEGFSIEAGQEAKIWVDIIGRSVTRPDRPQSYHIIYGNSGNIDALGVPIWVRGIPSGASINVTSEVVNPPILPEHASFDWDAIPEYVEVDGEIVLPLLVPRIPPGRSGVVSLVVSVPNTVNSYSLQTWANPPMFQSSSTANLVDCITGLFGFLPGTGCILNAMQPLLDVIAGTLDERTVFWWTKWGAGLILSCTTGSPAVRDIIDLLSSTINDIVGATSTLESCLAIFRTLSSKTLTITTVQSYDPNDKIGSPGAGDVRYISGREPLRYSIYFENLENASAPAQEVVITDQLAMSKLDIETFSFGPIHFGETVYTPPPGVKNIATEIDLRPNNPLIVRINARFDTNTGQLTWHFASIDPETGAQPADPLTGFLPPNHNPPEGDGGVLFTVMPSEGLSTGTTLQNNASIVFDTNDPILTPTWINTVDNSSPTSSIESIAETAILSEYLVSLNGSDEGSGISSYDLYVSEDGRVFQLWRSGIESDTLIFPAKSDTHYDFSVIAIDASGNTEQKAITVENSIDTPIYKSPGKNGNGNGGCFIATAAYGDPLHNDLKVLRAFRDEYLLTNYYGTIFVDMYYEHSPPIAKYIYQNESMKYLVRVMLKPTVYFLQHPVSTLIMLLLVIYASKRLYSQRKHRKY